MSSLTRWEITVQITFNKQREKHSFGGEASWSMSVRNFFLTHNRQLTLHRTSEIRPTWGDSHLICCSILKGFQECWQSWREVIRGSAKSLTLNTLFVRFGHGAVCRTAKSQSERGLAVSKRICWFTRGIPRIGGRTRRRLVLPPLPRLPNTSNCPHLLWAVPCGICERRVWLNRNSDTVRTVARAVCCLSWSSLKCAKKYHCHA